MVPFWTLSIQSVLRSTVGAAGSSLLSATVTAIRATMPPPITKYFLRLLTGARGISKGRPLPVFQAGRHRDGHRVRGKQYTHARRGACRLRQLRKPFKHNTLRGCAAGLRRGCVIESGTRCPFPDTEPSSCTAGERVWLHRRPLHTAAHGSGSWLGLMARAH